MQAESHCNSEAQGSTQNRVAGVRCGVRRSGRRGAWGGEGRVREAGGRAAMMAKNQSSMFSMVCKKGQRVYSEKRGVNQMVWCVVCCGVVMQMAVVVLCGGVCVCKMNRGRQRGSACGAGSGVCGRRCVWANGQCCRNQNRRINTGCA